MNLDPAGIRKVLEEGVQTGLVYRLGNIQVRHGPFKVGASEAARFARFVKEVEEYGLSTCDF